MSGANMMRGFGNCVRKSKRRLKGMTGGEAGNLSVERSFIIIIIIGREIMMMMMGRMCLIMIMRMKEGGKVESMFLVEVVEVVEEEEGK